MTNAADVNPETLDLDAFGRLLRASDLVSDAEIFREPEAARITALIVPQGYRPAHVLRRHAMILAGEAGALVQVAIVRAIPRDARGAFDQVEAQTAIELQGAVHRFEPARTEAERTLAGLVLEVLPGVQVSMSDSLADLGGDSLAAIELSALISEELGIEIDAQAIFAADSLRRLVAVIDSNGASASTS